MGKGEGEEIKDLEILNWYEIFENQKLNKTGNIKYTIRNYHFFYHSIRATANDKSTNH